MNGPAPAREPGHGASRGEGHAAVPPPPARPPGAAGRVLRDPAALPPFLARPVLAVGNFDGVHRGHAAVIGAARALAARLGRPAAALTFEPHPRAWFRPEAPFFRLTPPPLKAEALLALGLDGVIELTFDAALAATPAADFAALVAERLGASGLAVGHDFHFGRGREGGPAFLAAEGARRGLAVEVVAPLLAGDGPGAAPVSSSAVRAALAAGEPDVAAALMGRPWRVRGEVVGGDRRGRLLGYPTANQVLDPATDLRHGIYAVRVGLDGARHDAVASFGRRPTFDDGAPRLETHLFDFADDLYGRVMDVDVVAFLRPEERFESAAALVAQMDRDSARARAVLAESVPAGGAPAGP